MSRSRSKSPHFLRPSISSEFPSFSSTKSRSRSLSAGRPRFVQRDVKGDDPPTADGTETRYVTVQAKKPPSRPMSTTSRSSSKSRGRNSYYYDLESFDEGTGFTILNCFKWFMMLTSIVLILGGISIFLLGGIMIFDNTFTGKLIGINFFLSTVYVLLGAGFLSVVLGTIGCVGAIRTSKFLILMYMILSLAILMIITLGVMAAVIGRPWVRKVTNQHMTSLLKFYSTNSIIRDAWDSTQSGLECCGVTSFEDWPADELPRSCCRYGKCKDDESVFKAGCLAETETFWDQHTFNIGVTTGGVTFIIFCGLTSACGYNKALKKCR